MKRCPKDAQTKMPETEFCDSKSELFDCTRPKGHAGKHHAHDYDYEKPEEFLCVKTWTGADGGKDT